MNKGSKHNRQLHSDAVDGTSAVQEHRQDWIAERAYQRFQMRGGEHGHDQDDWFEAERELEERADSHEHRAR